jgi:hypothetical protein
MSLVNDHNSFVPLTTQTLQKIGAAAEHLIIVTDDQRSFPGRVHRFLMGTTPRPQTQSHRFLSMERILEKHLWHACSLLREEASAPFRAGRAAVLPNGQAHILPGDEVHRSKVAFFPDHPGCLDSHRMLGLPTGKEQRYSIDLQCGLQCRGQTHGGLSQPGRGMSHEVSPLGHAHPGILQKSLLAFPDHSMGEQSRSSSLFSIYMHLTGFHTSAMLFAPSNPL